MRFLAALVAVCFGFVTNQPLYDAPCPHHTPALAMLAEGLVSAHAQHQAHEEYDAHAMPGHASHLAHGSKGHDHGVNDVCHCLGACCVATPVALAQPTVQLVPGSVAVYVGATPLTDFARAPDGPTPYTLPLSTAPPVSLLA